MYNEYLACYHSLTRILKDNYKEYAFRNLYDHEPIFANPCEFYNFIVINYFQANHLITNVHAIYLRWDMKIRKRITHTIFDELMNCSFKFDKSYKRDFEVYACEEYISEEIGQDLLVIENYLAKNNILTAEKINLVLTQVKNQLKKNVYRSKK